MSRVGNASITLPKGVELNVAADAIKVKGPLGELQTALPDGIQIEQEDGTLQVKRTDDSRKTRALHGTVRALLNNNIIGVTDGWKRKLELIGVGYRAQLKGKELVLSLGYSHEVRYALPEGVKAEVTDQIRLELSSMNRQQLGQVAAEIRGLRPPEPYKGKGVRYADEQVRRKAGKAGKAGKK